MFEMIWPSQTQKKRNDRIITRDTTLPTCWNSSRGRRISRDLFVLFARFQIVIQDVPLNIVDFETKQVSVENEGKRNVPRKQINVVGYFPAFCPANSMS